MLRPRPHRKPTFLWQGVLILLPVGVMCVVGLAAIWRDRTAVEQEARRRAGEIADQLAAGLATRVPAHLATYDLFASTWLKHNRDLATIPRLMPQEDSFPSRLAEWQSMNSSLHPEQVLPNHLLFNANGKMVWPPDNLEAPQPARWLLELTREQRQAWDLLLQTELAAAGLTRVDAKVKEFLDSNPSDEARANADFIWLRTSLAGQAGSKALLDIERSSAGYHGLRAESGLPLLSLAAAEALGLARNSVAAQAVLLGNLGDSENFFNEILAWLLDEPSLLTPILLTQLDSLVNSRTNAAEKFAVPIQAAKTVWFAQRRLHEIGETIQRRGTLRGTTTTNFWLESPTGTWFCRANPERITNAERNSAGVITQRTNEAIGMSIYPKASVEHAFGRAVQDLAISIPDYFGLNLELEGESLALTHSKRSGSAMPLAEARASLAVVRVSLISDPTPAGQRKTALEHPGVPGAPLLAVQISLADRELLFVHQRQRILFFGGLIVASGIAALAGFFAAYRSFRHQLRLGELKSNFVSSVSHELRAPIASVRLMAESLEHGRIPDPRKQHDYFHFIVRECRRLSSLIENVLDFSRIEQGRKQFEFEPTDIIALTKQTVKLMEAYATERRVGLAISLPGPECSTDLQFTADGKALQQALINLIDNAVRHSPKGETVRVGLEVRNSECGVRNDRGGVALWVEDRGEGIPAAEHQKIFERFYRLGSELRRETQGVGIGLSIVKHVVEAHGGRVLVRSAVGQGSRFTIELPLGTANQKTEGRNPKAE
jgi:signal transduction histidine kinase